MCVIGEETDPAGASRLVVRYVEDVLAFKFSLASVTEMVVHIEIKNWHNYSSPPSVKTQC